MDIKNIRKKLNMSQQEFGNLCGVSRVYISNLENNKINNPGSKTLRQIEESINNYIFFSNDVNHTQQIEKGK